MTLPENLLSVREAAAYLGCDETAVQRLVRRRLLRAVRVGPRLRFRRADLDRYLAQRSPRPVAGAQAPRPAVSRLRDPSVESEILHAVAVATAGEHRLDRLLAGVLEQLGYAVVFTGASIALVEGDDLVIRAAVGPFASTALGLRQSRGKGISWQVVTTGEPFLSNDLLAEGRRPSSNFRSYLAVPLIWRGAAIGMLELDSVVPNAFTADDLRLVQRVALALSGAVELARRYASEVSALAAAEKAQQRLSLLAEVSAAFAAAGLELPAVLEIIARRTAEVLGDACSILLRSEDGEQLDLAASYHPDPALRARIQAILSAVPYRLGTATANSVIHSGQPLLLPTLDRDRLRAITNPDYWPYLDEIPIASLLVVPLRAHGQPLGVLTMSRDQPGRPYTAEDQQLLQDLADRAALAIANAQLHAAVTEQREWFRTTLASIGDAVIVTDVEGRVRFLNPVAAALTGWPAEEAVGRSLADVFRVVDETTGAPVASPAEVVLREGATVGLANQTVLLARDGREVPIDDSGAPMRDGQGRLSGVVLVFRDIAARRAAERELRQSRDQLAIILRGIADGITVQDRRGALVYANDAAARLCGFADATEMLATPGREIVQRFAIFDADGAPFPLDRLPGRLALQGKSGPEVELRFRALPSGVERWAAVVATPVYGADGTVELAVNIFRDITAHKRTELAQRFLSEAGAALAASLDETTTLRTVAALVVPALADWCIVDLLRDDGTFETVAVAHADPAKVAMGWELARRYPPAPDASFGTAHVLRTGRPEVLSDVPEHLLAAVARDADHLNLLRTLGVRATMCVPLLAGGRAIGTLAFVSERPGRFGHDDLALAEELARRVGMALENARLYTAAQAAIAARDQFLSIASHELKTPLTALLGYVGLLQRRLGQRSAVDPRDMRALQVIAAQTQRLDRLILALLDLSRLQAGQLSIQPAPLDLSVLARQVVEETQPTLEHHTLTLDLPEGPVVINADRLRLEQAVLNLVQNAVKYSPGGGEVLVRVFVRETVACLAVRDEGIGIPPDALPQLFRRFYRAPNVNGQRISGMGVGLYVVHEIVALHGGTVEVASQEGRGSTFTLCFPYHPVEPAAPEGELAAAPIASPTTPSETARAREQSAP